MTPTDPQKTYQEFQERFNAMSDDELIDAFNREVGNPGCTSSRATYLTLLHEEFKKRRFDYSVIGSVGGLSLNKKVKLIDKEIVFDETVSTPLVGANMPVCR